MEQAAKTLISDLALGRTGTDLVLTEDQKLLSIPSHLVYLAGLVLALRGNSSNKGPNKAPFPPEQSNFQLYSSVSLQDQFVEFQALFDSHFEKPQDTNADAAFGKKSNPPQNKRPTFHHLSPRLAPTEKQRKAIQEDLSRTLQTLEEKANAVLCELLNEDDRERMRPGARHHQRAAVAMVDGIRKPKMGRTKRPVSQQYKVPTSKIINTNPSSQLAERSIDDSDSDDSVEAKKHTSPSGKTLSEDPYQLKTLRITTARSSENAKASDECADPSSWITVAKRKASSGGGEASVATTAAEGFADARTSDERAEERFQNPPSLRRNPGQEHMNHMVPSRSKSTDARTSDERAEERIQDPPSGQERVNHRLTSRSKSTDDSDSHSKSTDDSDSGSGAAGMSYLNVAQQQKQQRATTLDSTEASTMTLPTKLSLPTSSKSDTLLSRNSNAHDEKSTSTRSHSNAITRTPTATSPRSYQDAKDDLPSTINPESFSSSSTAALQERIRQLEAQLALAQQQPQTQRSSRFRDDSTDDRRAHHPPTAAHDELESSPSHQDCQDEQQHRNQNHQKELRELRLVHARELQAEKERCDTILQALQLRVYISETRLFTYQEALEEHVQAVAENTYYSPSSPRNTHNNHNASHNHHYSSRTTTTSPSASDHCSTVATAIGGKESHVAPLALSSQHPPQKQTQQQTHPSSPLISRVLQQQNRLEDAS